MEQTEVRIRAAKDDLAGAVSWVARNLPARPTQPILRGMIFLADDNGLQLAGYDYEVSTQIRIAQRSMSPVASPSMASWFLTLSLSCRISR